MCVGCITNYMSLCLDSSYKTALYYSVCVCVSVRVCVLVCVF